jgi:hypothetical protein
MRLQIAGARRGMTGEAAGKVMGAAPWRLWRGFLCNLRRHVWC